MRYVVALGAVLVAGCGEPDDPHVSDGDYAFTDPVDGEYAFEFGNPPPSDCGCTDARSMFPYDSALVQDGRLVLSGDGVETVSVQLHGHDLSSFTIGYGDRTLSFPPCYMYFGVDASGQAFNSELVTVAVRDGLCSCTESLTLVGEMLP